MSLSKTEKEILDECILAELDERFPTWADASAIAGSIKFAARERISARRVDAYVVGARMRSKGIRSKVEARPPDGIYGVTRYRRAPRP